MRINVLLAGSILSLACAAQAQDLENLHSKGKVSYHNQFSTGVLAGGEYGLVTGSVTTVHGVALGHWTIGAGIGIEGYERWRTVPLFGSLSYHFCGPTASGVFLSFNAGHGFGRLLENQDGLEVDTTKGGPMVNPMIGYQITASKFNISLAAGYKRQQMGGNYVDTFNGSFSYSIEETMDRFLFQLGLGIR